MLLWERRRESPPRPPSPRAHLGAATEQRKQYKSDWELPLHGRAAGSQPATAHHAAGNAGQRNLLTYLRAPRPPRRPAPRPRVAHSRSWPTGCPWPGAPGSGWAQTSPPRPPAASPHRAGPPALAAGSCPPPRTLLRAPARGPTPPGRRRPCWRPSWPCHVAARVAPPPDARAGVSVRALAVPLSSGRVFLLSLLPFWAGLGGWAGGRGTGHNLSSDRLRTCGGC